MNPNILSYKGYWSKLEFSQSDKVFHGKIEGISDLVTFESESAQEIEAEFHNAVDDYLSFCQDVGKSPDKSYNGSFNIRISPTLHKDLARLASINNQSINSFVEQAISDKVYGNSTKIEEIFEYTISQIAQAYTLNNDSFYSPYSKYSGDTDFNSSNVVFIQEAAS